jgi:signal transduction histidine kinase
MSISPYSIPPLLSSLAVFGIGIYVLKKNIHSPLNRLFFLLCLTIVGWLIPTGISYSLTAAQLPSIQLLHRIKYCSVPFIAIVYFHYLIRFLQISKYQRWIQGNYLYGTVMCIISMKTNLLIDGVYHFSWGFYAKAGRLHSLFLCYFFYLILFALYALIKTLRQPSLPIYQKNQSKYVLVAFSIFFLAALDFVPKYGIDLYPLGYFYVLIFISIIAYAGVKHNLMDINIVLKTSLVYSSLVTFIILTYAITVLMAEKLFQNWLGYQNLIVSIISAIIIAICFAPLRYRIQCLADKLFFTKSPIELVEENKNLRHHSLQTEKFKAVATLASGLAHEIKNPLTAITTFSEFLPQRLDDKAFLEKFARIVGKEASRIDAMINRLLDFAKPSRPQLQPTPIVKLIEETMDFLNSELIKRHITSQIHSDQGSELTIHIDPHQIRQALLNILINAIEAMPHGGKLMVSIQRLDHHLRIIIVDSGIGMSQEDLQQIFNPFFTRKDNGTGLGLSITQGIVEEHGGTITVQSQEGAGTKFSIDLPIQGNPLQVIS